MSNDNSIIVICGPTASGKSEVANILAYDNNGNVISADSRQIYKYMNIGTCKFPKHSWLVKHWGLDIVDPSDNFSVAMYQKYARNLINKLTIKNIKPILCGGTGFYIRSVIDDYNFAPGNSESSSRKKFEKYKEKNGNKALWELLYKSDPKSALLIHENNSVRVIRALEMLEGNTNYYKQVNKLKNIGQYYNTKIFGLNVDRKLLYNRINNRVEQMFDNGFVEEVQKILNMGYDLSLRSLNTIGYKEVIEYLYGKYDITECKDKIKTNTRRYAKRQITWFNHDKRIHWINNNNLDSQHVATQIENNI